MSSKKQQTVLVTGCSAGGIGAAIAQELARHGHHVYATARTASKIPTEISELPNVTVLQLDVTSTESVRAAAQAVPRLDVLVNNAGQGYTMPLLDLDIDHAQRLHDTNVWGAIRTIQAFAGLLIASQGRVVNISSVGAVVNTPWIGEPDELALEWSSLLTSWTGAYASSKAALNSLSDTLRLELAPFNVSVVTIMVGTVTTGFHANEPDVVLPRGSRYSLIQDTINRWAKGLAGPKGGSSREFAESIVEDIVGSGNAVLWRGANSGAVKFASAWLPRSLLVSFAERKMIRERTLTCDCVG
jgi:NAD(P)-dependent dehydrogenase (short-subunit alcohol dehydrogenase family)